MSAYKLWQVELYQVLKPQVQVQVQVLSLQVQVQVPTSKMQVQVQVFRYKVQVHRFRCKYWSVVTSETISSRSINRLRKKPLQ